MASRQHISWLIHVGRQNMDKRGVNVLDGEAVKAVNQAGAEYPDEIAAALLQLSEGVEVGHESQI